MELLEREPFLAELDQALAEAGAGSGRIALVSGEAGIGKTSLVESFTRRHGQAVRILWGECDSLATPRPLGPLHDMAPHLEDDSAGSLPGLIQSGGSPAAIFSHMLAELQLRPTIAVFEDVHWADEATLDLLRFLGRRITRTKTLLVLTYRDDELGLQHPLRSLLGDLASSAVALRILLPRLSVGAVRDLVGERGLNAAELHQRTGGNPFFVTEVLASPAEGIPATVRDAVLARAASLSPAARGVLEAASVVGMRTEPWLLDALLPTPIGEEPGSLDEAVAAGMLIFQGDFLAFRHELARQTILETILPPRRRELQRSVLRSLESSPATRNDLARLAHHAGAAGEGRAVLEYATAAARQAVAASAHREAVALYALAIDYAGGLPLEEQARLLQSYAQECNSIDDRIRGVQALRQALEIWRRLEQPVGQGSTLAQMAGMLEGLGRDAEAKQACREAIRILEAQPPGRELAYAYRVCAGLNMVEHKIREAISWAEKCIALAQQFQDTANLYAAQSILGACWMDLDYERGCRMLEASGEAAHQAGRKTTAALAYANLGSISSEFYKFRRAAAYLEEGLAYITQHDLDHLRYYMLAWKSVTAVYLGRWEQAAEAAGEVLRSGLRSTTGRFIALVSLGRLRTRQGSPEGQALLDAALELSRSMSSIDRLGPMRIARAEAAWLAGDRDRAREEARSIYELAMSRPQAWYAGELAFWLRKAGDTPRLPDWIARPYALQIAGDWRAAADEWERLDCPYEQAQALADGDMAAQAAAVVIFERLGAQPAAEALRRALRSADARKIPQKPRASTRRNPFRLTARQLQILELLIEGQSNMEIAGRLNIALKTVDHHVSAVLSKLGVHSRQAAAEVAREDPRFMKK